jgi:hypothetical protein
MKKKTKYILKIEFNITDASAINAIYEEYAVHAAEIVEGYGLGEFVKAEGQLIPTKKIKEK